MPSGGSGVKSDDLGAAGTAQNQSAAAYNQLMPTYANLASGNAGLTQQQKSNLLTASGQSLGGSTAGITGQAALNAARTGNAGSYAALADSAGMNGQQMQSQQALGVQNTSDQLAQQNQRIGLQGEQGIFDNANQTGATYMNLANQAKPSYWQQLAGGLTSTALGIGGAAAGKYV